MPLHLHPQRTAVHEIALLQSTALTELVGCIAQQEYAMSMHAPVMDAF
eukprot:COSAG02_NODE_46015_length_352_cov_1.011858_2_plen_47_part_01